MLQKTRIILWVGGAVGLLAIFVVLLVAFRRPSEPTQTPTSSQPQPTRAQTRIDQTINAILGGADATTCQNAGSREAIDRCFTTIARAKNDAALCGAVQNAEAATRCRDEQTVLRVRQGGDPDDCLSVTTDALRRTCVIEAVQQGVSDSYCAGFSGDTKIFCSDWIRMTRSLTGDAGACDGITDEELRGECYATAAAPVSVEEVSPAPPAPALSAQDTDRDGLNDLEEQERYGTDPRDPDTDSDGFSDGTEVRNGYNPNGPGRL